MAEKSHSFSIFLLKSSADPASSLDPNHDLVEADGSLVPSGGRLYLFDRLPTPPWWRDYFGMSQDLKQVLKGSILFLPVKGRFFALTFGQVSHFLEEESYEHDFGLRVTLNCVDRDKLKNTDVLEPGAARRQRTQVAVSSDLTFFDFDRDSKVMRSLTGVVAEAYQDFFRQATGSASLRVTTKFRSADLAKLCEELLSLYGSVRYKTTFPDVQNIVPVNDPVKVASLDEALLMKFRDRSPSFSVSFPALLDYSDELVFRFSGAGPSWEYEELHRELVYEYLDSAGFNVGTSDVTTLKELRVHVATEGGGTRTSSSLYRSIVIDIDDLDEGAVYHLSEGDWYRFEANYVQRIVTYLDPRYEAMDLPDCDRHREDEYNVDASNAKDLVNLDKTNVSPSGQSKIEPCDLLGVSDLDVALIHVKISTTSDKLSHLFNQGVNSARLLLSEPDSREKLVSLVASRSQAGVSELVRAAIERRDIAVKFAMITHKPHDAKAKNLPLFSRVSLMRAIKELELLGVDASFGFVKDVAPSRAGKPHERKKSARSKVSFVDLSSE